MAFLGSPDNVMYVFHGLPLVYYTVGLFCAIVLNQSDRQRRKAIVKTGTADGP